MRRFVPNKSFGKLLGISSKQLFFFKKKELLYIKVRFIDPLEIEYRIKFTLIIKCIYYKNAWFFELIKRYSTELRYQIYVKVYGFLSFAKNISKNSNKSVNEKPKSKTC